MTVWAVLLIAVSVAADAFAVSLGRGLAMRPFRHGDALAMAATFGIFQGVMPLLGWLLGSGFAPWISAFDHWVAFALLTIIGARMVKESFGEDDEEDDDPLTLRQLLVLGVATSIDALVVGVGLALMHVDIVPVVSAVAAVTFALSLLGTYLGHHMGARFGRPAEILGGLILIGIGTSTLVEHLTA